MSYNVLLDEEELPWSYSIFSYKAIQKSIANIPLEPQGASLEGDDIHIRKFERTDLVEDWESWKKIRAEDFIEPHYELRLDHPICLHAKIDNITNFNILILPYVSSYFLYCLKKQNDTPAHNCVFYIYTKFGIFPYHNKSDGDVFHSFFQEKSKDGKLELLNKNVEIEKKKYISSLYEKYKYNFILIVAPVAVASSEYEGEWFFFNLSPFCVSWKLPDFVSLHYEHKDRILYKRSSSSFVPPYRQNRSYCNYTVYNFRFRVYSYEEWLGFLVNLLKVVEKKIFNYRLRNKPEQIAFILQSSGAGVGGQIFDKSTAWAAKHAILYWKELLPHSYDFGVIYRKGYKSQLYQNSSKVRHVIYCDDASYSGNQVSDTISYVLGALLEKYKLSPTFHIVLPVVSYRALRRIQFDYRNSKPLFYIANGYYSVNYLPNLRCANSCGEFDRKYFEERAFEKAEYDPSSRLIFYIGEVAPTDANFQVKEASHH